MAFKFNVKPVATEPMDMIDLLQAQEELNQAFMDLTDAQKSMTEVCEVMENIQTSVNLITKYGAAGVEQLNMDGSLEDLLQVPAKLITAEKAQEGLGEAAKAAWEKFKEWCLKAWEFIRGIFTKMITLVSNAFNSAKEKIATIKAASKESIEAAGEMKVNTNTATESLQDWFKPTSLYPAEMIREVAKDYYNVMRGFERLLSDYDPAAMISEYVDLAIKDPDNAEKIANDFLDTKVKTFIDEVTRNHGKLEFKIKYNGTERTHFPTPMVEFYSNKLKEYSPVESTYRALGWTSNGAENTIGLLESWGDIQVTVGKLSAVADGFLPKIKSVVDEAEKKMEASGVNNFKASAIGALSLAIGKTCLSIGLYEIDIIKATVKELQPMVDALSTR